MSRVREGVEDGLGDVRLEAGPSQPHLRVGLPELHVVAVEQLLHQVGLGVLRAVDGHRAREGDQLTEGERIDEEHAVDRSERAARGHLLEDRRGRREVGRGRRPAEVAADPHQPVQRPELARRDPPIWGQDHVGRLHELAELDVATPDLGDAHAQRHPAAGGHLGVVPRQHEVAVGAGQDRLRRREQLSAVAELALARRDQRGRARRRRSAEAGGGDPARRRRARPTRPRSDRAGPSPRRTAPTDPVGCRRRRGPRRWRCRSRGRRRRDRTTTSSGHGRRRSGRPPRGRETACGATGSTPRGRRRTRGGAAPGWPAP